MKNFNCVVLNYLTINFNQRFIIHDIKNIGKIKSIVECHDDFERHSKGLNHFDL